MQTVLIKNIHTLVPMTDEGSVQHDVDMLLENGRIARIAKDIELPPDTDARVIQGDQHAVYPGFINTHHHFYQTLTRNLPKVQNAKLFDWLIGLYEVWRELDAEAVRISTQIALGELLLSGCTTTTDHFYVFPSSAPQEFLDIEIDTAREMGVRFHPMRGSMSRGKSGGGLPPDDVVQEADRILEDCDRLISKYHDPEPFSMCRLVLAPCSPFSITTDLLKQTAVLARDRGVFMHTHLCETRDEEDFCVQNLGQRPLDYMASCGWVGPDVWYAHGIYFNDEEIKRLGETKTGIAHCPASNLRLGSGICRVPALLNAGVRVGLAVDGSASNDSSSLLREMQLALMVHRVGTGVDQMPPQTVLNLATRGGASIFGQPEIGQLREGDAADVAMFRLDRIDFAGAMHDPASAILFCGSGVRADYTIVAGRVLVENEKLVDLDEQELFHEANRVADRMVTVTEQKLGESYR